MTAKKTAQPSEDRDDRGRFKPGCAPGPGNPNVKKIAAMRAAIIRAATPPEAVEVMQALHRLCTEDGNVSACSLWLQRIAGSPDSVDLVVELDELRQALEEIQGQVRAEGAA